MATATCAARWCGRGPAWAAATRLASTSSTTRWQPSNCWCGFSVSPTLLRSPRTVPLDRPGKHRRPGVWTRRHLHSLDPTFCRNFYNHAASGELDTRLLRRHWLSLRDHFGCAGGVGRQMHRSKMRYRHLSTAIPAKLAAVMVKLTGSEVSLRDRVIWDRKLRHILFSNYFF